MAAQLQVSENSRYLTRGLVNPGHELQDRFARRHWPVVESRSRKPQQHTLPVDTELRVVLIDQLAQFMGVKQLRFFGDTSAPSPGDRSAGTAHPPWHEPLTYLCSANVA